MSGQRDIFFGGECVPSGHFEMRVGNVANFEMKRELTIRGPTTFLKARFLLQANFRRGTSGTRPTCLRKAQIQPITLHKSPLLLLRFAEACVTDQRGCRARSWSKKTLRCSYQTL